MVFIEGYIIAHIRREGKDIIYSFPDYFILKDRLPEQKEPVSM